jgi:hypothetical protein
MFAGEREQDPIAEVVVPDEQEIGAGQPRTRPVRARREIARVVVVVEAEQAILNDKSARFGHISTQDRIH